MNIKKATCMVPQKLFSAEIKNKLGRRLGKVLNRWMEHFQELLNDKEEEHNYRELVNENGTEEWKSDATPTEFDIRTAI